MPSFNAQPFLLFQISNLSWARAKPSRLLSRPAPALANWNLKKTSKGKRKQNGFLLANFKETLLYFFYHFCWTRRYHLHQCWQSAQTHRHALLWIYRACEDLGIVPTVCEIVHCSFPTCMSFRVGWFVLERTIDRTTCISFPKFELIGSNS